tara:strand:+ start:246 stop:506 length:261 start_codon:yes stop_codon:yes gene_type:complete
MKVDNEMLIKALKKSIVSLRFIGLNSGREQTIPVTLKPEYLPSHFTLNQSVNSDTILMYRLDFKQWEDIRVTSIVTWEGMAGTDEV